jgi:hypothetical protein
MNIETMSDPKFDFDGCFISDMNTDDVLAVFIHAILCKSERVRILMLYSGCLGVEMETFHDVLRRIPTDKVVEIEYDDDRGSSFIGEKSRYRSDLQAFEGMQNCLEVRENITIKRWTGDSGRIVDLFVVAPYSMKASYWERISQVKACWLGISYNTSTILPLDFVAAAAAGSERQQQQRTTSRTPSEELAHIESLKNKYPMMTTNVWNGYGSISKDAKKTEGCSVNIGKVLLKSFSLDLWNVVKHASVSFAERQYLKASKYCGHLPQVAYENLTKDHVSHVRQIFAHAFEESKKEGGSGRGNSFFKTNGVNAVIAQIEDRPEDEVSDVIPVVCAMLGDKMKNVYHKCDLKVDMFVSPEWRDDGGYCYIRFDEGKEVIEFTKTVVELLSSLFEVPFQTSL